MDPYGMHIKHTQTLNKRTHKDAQVITVFLT